MEPTSNLPKPETLMQIKSGTKITKLKKRKRKKKPKGKTQLNARSIDCLDRAKNA